MIQDHRTVLHRTIESDTCERITGAFWNLLHERGFDSATVDATIRHFEGDHIICSSARFLGRYAGWTNVVRQGQNVGGRMTLAVYDEPGPAIAAALRLAEERLEFERLMKDDPSEE